MISILKKINNIKFPKIIQKNNFFYIFGIKSTLVYDNVNKFIIYYEKYSLDFSFIEKKNLDFSSEESILIWDISENLDTYIFLLEEKSVDKKIHSNKYYKYYIKKEELEYFKIDKIEKIELENYLISKIKYNTYFSSKIEIDEERPDYYWGKYLFHFKNENNTFYKPNFNKFVDYQKDKGHLIHYIDEIVNKNIYNDILNKKYLIIFSIRHKCELKPDNYYYKIYSSYSDNLINFYNTKIVDISNLVSDAKWYCYPEVFKHNEKLYVLLNQDDFGKEKETLLGEIIID